MRRVSIADITFSYDDSDPEGFRSGGRRLGRDLGARLTGTSVYELPPGQALCPYHYEYGEEEWLLVLEGRPSLRHPDGTDRLEQWDLVFFPSGPEGAHRVQNDTDEPVRIMMYSSVNTPAASVYPDSDKVAIWTGNDADNVLVRRSSAVAYWDGE
ncbi:MAG TPA: cupin domain-containing protein [Gaiellales bacterium]|jgi:uncharacterized cupin superfamily protein|nr:cupin domain-containing protein [Gaiellales bacterium]